jgi:hypothetical protein
MVDRTTRHFALAVSARSTRRRLTACDERRRDGMTRLVAVATQLRTESECCIQTASRCMRRVLASGSSLAGPLVPDARLPGPLWPVIPELRQSVVLRQA